MGPEGPLFVIEFEDVTDAVEELVPI